MSNPHPHTSDSPLRVVVSLDVEEEGLFSGHYATSGCGVSNVSLLPRLAPLSRDLGFPLTLFCAHTVFADAEADAFFPDLDADPHWQVERESEIFEENGLRYQFVDYIPRTEERSETELPPERDEPVPFAPEMDFSDLTGIL